MIIIGRRRIGSACPEALAVAFLFLFLCHGAAQDSALLQTGQGTSLQRVPLPFQWSSNLPAASLRFDFSFGTDERLQSGELYDSFSITLRDTNRTWVLALLTADLFGVAWKPLNPGGSPFPADLAYEQRPADLQVRGFAVGVSYSIAVDLPLVMLGQGGVLSLSLFDNTDTERSLALVTNLSVGPGFKQPLVVESGNSVTGTFTEEMSPLINRLRREILLPGGGAARFFRLRADQPSRIISFARAGDELVITYEGGATNITLEAATRPLGPFTTEPILRFDHALRQIAIPRQPPVRFYRLRSDIPLRIHRIEHRNGDAILHYELP